MDRNGFISKSRGSIRPIARPIVINILKPIEAEQILQPAIIEERIIANPPEIKKIDPTYAKPVSLVVDKAIIKPNNNFVDYKPKIETISKTGLSSNYVKLLARTANKTMLLSKAVENEVKNNKKSKAWHKKLAVRRSAVGLAVFLILASTGYISFTTWQTNTQAKEVLSSLEKSAKSDLVNKNLVEAEPKVQKTTAENSDKPVNNDLDQYQVASDQPRAIYINKINVAAKILPMGVNADSSLQAPVNAYDAGWYTSSAKPGQDGAILIDGHASETGTHYGLFGYLVDIVVGDEVIIERGDGVKFTYIVKNISTEPVDGLDMSKTLVPFGDAKQGVNLIACAGSWKADGSTLDQRLIVYATLQ